MSSQARRAHQRSGQVRWPWFGFALLWWTTAGCITGGAAVSLRRGDPREWVEEPPLTAEVVRGCLRISATDAAFPSGVGLVIRGPDVPECRPGDSYEVELRSTTGMFIPAQVSLRHQLEAKQTVLARAELDGGVEREPRVVKRSRAVGVDGGLVGEVGAVFNLPGRFALSDSNESARSSDRIEDYFSSTLSPAQPADAGSQ